jgi:LemA protein
MILPIILGIVVIIIVWGIATYNGLIQLKNKGEEAFATMDVYLKKRYDLIPNLVETVKGYAKHESETLEKVISARNLAVSANSVEESANAEKALAGSLKSLLAIAEAYPDLKANTNFINLQQQLNQIENDIANARKYYNAVVRQFNTKCEMFPSVIIANMGGFIKKPMFEVDTPQERENVKVQF